ncbi:MAG: translocation protein S66 [Trichoglossum hirsutum]|nr:MAG: translocation protein S66 [Trichoglossum hirsutum]
MFHWVGLLMPITYIGVLVGSLATFSSLYRRRKAAKATSLEPWFDPHIPRNIYLSLLHLEPAPGQKSPVVPDSVLRAALLRRATEDIYRVLAIRSAKAALGVLVQRGSVGDDLWQRFQRAEQEIEDELRDVVTEANSFSAGWGASIFQTANEMASNVIIRKRVDDIQAQAKAETEWWEKKRATIQSEFMKELNESSEGPTTSSPTPQKPVTAAAATNTAQGGSDEDTVFVEGGGPAAQGAKGGAKKKKGKK